jgi:hypothetical protein
MKFIFREVIIFITKKKKIANYTVREEKNSVERSEATKIYKELQSA